MLRLRSSVADRRAEEFGALLRGHHGVRRLAHQPDEARARSHVFVPDGEPAAADVLVEKIAELGIPVDDYVLTKMDVVAPQHHHKHGEGGVDGFAWVEVVGAAKANSRPLARYLALINVL